MLSINKGKFQVFLEGIRKRRIYFDRMTGNNGDKLITMGAERLLKGCGCKTVPEPQQAEYILLNGGNTTDTWPGRVHKLDDYKRNYPATPVVIAPSSFSFKSIDFREVCEINNSLVFLFARERYSEEVLRNMNLSSHVRIELSRDLAFELSDTSFIRKLRECLSERHILIVMRRDPEGPAGILTKTHASWLPNRIRRPLSELRDWLTAYISKDIIEEIMNQEKMSFELPRIYRDVSDALSFGEFVKVISSSKAIITDRLHAGILGHLLNKKVVLVSRRDHKVKGIYEFSMSGPNSRTSLWKTEGQDNNR